MQSYIRRWDPDADEEQEQVLHAIHRAVERGITFFDTAPRYGSEELFGRALKPHRGRVFLATKVREMTSSAVLRSVEESLIRLQTDHVDLLQHHGDWYSDAEMERFFAPDGILAGLLDAKRRGLARFIGFTAEGPDGGVSRLIASDALDVVQIQYNVMFQHPYDPSKQSDVIYEAERRGMGVAVMRPLTGGVFERWMDKVGPGRVPVDWGRAMLDFVLSNPLVDVAIVGMRSAQRVEANCAASDDQSGRLDLDQLHGRFLRTTPETGQEVWMPTSGRAVTSPDEAR